MAAWSEYNNYIAYLDNAEFGEINLFHDNVIANMVPPSNSVHGNCIHLFGSANITEIIYNNYVTCLNTGTPDEMFLIEETGGATVYAFNNVMTKDGHGSGFEIKNGNTNYLFQNTQECGPDSSPASTCTQLSGNPMVTLRNNLGITSNSNNNTVTESGFSGTLTASVMASKTCSGGAQNLYGGTQICGPIGSGNGTGNLNRNQTYPFAPLDSTAAATVGTAANSISLCTEVSQINAEAGTACLKDTTLGVAYNTSSHTVSYPARTPIVHATSGNWQIGAYESGSGAAQPNPPAGLAAMVQ
jgi:hypothetical protein